MMPLPHRLPRSEIGWQVPPWATRAEPPRDAFQYQTMVTESVAPLALIGWHHRFDSRPELIRNHTHSRHRSIVAGQRLPIRETRPSRNGRFKLKRVTIAKRMRMALVRIKDELKRRMHQPIPKLGRWLASVVRGHMAYYAVPDNAPAVGAFRKQVTRHWLKTLRRRSQRTTITWARMSRLEIRWLPKVRIMHPYPKRAA